MYNMKKIFCWKKCLKNYKARFVFLDMAEPLLGQWRTGVGEIAGGDVDLH